MGVQIDIHIMPCCNSFPPAGAQTQILVTCLKVGGSKTWALQYFLLAELESVVAIFHNVILLSVILKILF